MQSALVAEVSSAPTAIKPPLAHVRFSTFDAMRGITAPLIAAYHFGLQQGRFWVPEANVAVDLFFLLSGFVIALSYTARLRTVSWSHFMVTRLIRLYPLYALGAVMGIVAVAWTSLRHPTQSLTPAYLAIDSLFSMAMVPTPAGFTPYLPAPLFPFNGPSWSLFFEVVVNLLFAVCLFRLPTRWLIGICIGAGLYLCVRIGSPVWLNGGADWSSIDVGAVRMLYSFPLGMLLWRLVPIRRGRDSWIALLLLVILASLMCLPIPPRYRTPFDLITVLGIVPILMVAGHHFEIPGPVKPLFFFLGDISYAVYAIHWPMIALFAFAMRRAHVPDLVATMLFVLFLILAGFLAHTYFDVPVRKRLSHWRRLAMNRGKSPAAAAPHLVK